MMEGMNEALHTPIMLYLPLAQRTNAFPWEVFHDTHRMGTFATQDECFRHALRLAESIGRRTGRRVRLKIEGDDGGWETVDAFVPEGVEA
jgi:hypothetical protein